MYKVQFSNGCDSGICMIDLFLRVFWSPRRAFGSVQWDKESTSLSLRAESVKLWMGSIVNPSRKVNQNLTGGGLPQDKDVPC